MCAVFDITNGETADFPMTGLDCSTEFRTPVEFYPLGQTRAVRGRGKSRSSSELG
jgi:hypothetical protein